MMKLDVVAMAAACLLAISSATANEDETDEVDRLQVAAMDLYRSGRYEEAIAAEKRTLRTAQRLLGREDPEVAAIVSDLAAMYLAANRATDAQECLELAERVFGSRNRSTIELILNLAVWYLGKGDPVRAVELGARALRLAETYLDTDNRLARASRVRLARAYERLGDTARALELLLQNYESEKRVQEEAASDIAASLQDIARLHAARNEFEGAKTGYQQAIELLQGIPGREEAVAIACRDLGVLYSKYRRFAAAEPLFARYAAIIDGLRGDNHLRMAEALSYLCATKQSLYGPHAAETDCLEAHRISSASGEDSPELAVALNNLAAVYEREERFAEARDMYEQALATYERLDQEPAGQLLSNLALLYSRQGNIEALSRAQELLVRAVSVLEKTWGSEDPHVGVALDNLGRIKREEGEYDEAARLAAQALDVLRKALGPVHPDVSATLNNLSLVAELRGRPAEAVRWARDAAAIERELLSDLLISSPESARRVYWKQLTDSTSHLISLQLNSPLVADAVDLALNTVLERKGLMLDAESDTLAWLRVTGSPKDSEAFVELRRLKRELANRILAGPTVDESLADHLAASERLSVASRSIEDSLWRQYRRPQLAPGHATATAIQRVLGEDDVLVEFVRYSPLDPRRSFAPADKARYVAYVLSGSGSPKSVDIGLAEPIDGLSQQLRGAIRSRARAYVSLARQLDEKLMQPLRPLFASRTDVIVSPDGELNMVPFAALVDERGRFLISRFRFTYVTSGRDLLREVNSTEAREPPLVLADPEYGPTRRISTRETRRTNRAGIVFAQQDSDAVMRVPYTEYHTRPFEVGTFFPLPDTRVEAQRIKALVPLARVLTGRGATESAVLRVHGPRIIHFATHGFFKAGGDERRRASIGDLAIYRPMIPPLDPMLRSGLALANANVPRGSAGDGVLTALELSTLDLRGTKLAILSACETGLGMEHAGDGVYGLRRALLLAGAESQVTSLWRVDSSATQTMMVAYYSHLMSGAGRSDALRESQLQLLAAPGTAHPRFWAAFVASGSRRTLDGGLPGRVRPADSANIRVLSVAPGTRGCSCQVVAARRDGANALAAGILLSALSIRARRNRGRPKRSSQT